MPSHRITNADDVRTGGAASPNRVLLGVPVSNVVAQAITPAAAAANNIATSQAVNTTTAVLNGSLVSGGVATLDVPRNVVAAWTGTAIVTVTGKDEYGQTVVEQSASGTSFTGKKAFKTVTSVSFNANVTAATVGTGTALGLKYRPIRGGFVRGVLGENTTDAGTYAAPERSASTATTNDVRGTYAPAGTLNGTNVFTVLYVAANGPQDSDAFGIAQFAG